MPLNPRVYGTGTFGVGQDAEGFLPQNTQSVALPNRLPRLRLGYDQFRQEPAITGLDWLFTPNPRLEEHLSVATLQASTKHWLRFTLPRVSSTRFRSDSCDSWRFKTIPLAEAAGNRFRCGFSLNRIILATEINSLAQYSNRTSELLVEALTHHSC